MSAACRLTVNLKESRDAGGAQEWRVAGQDHHVAVGVANRVVDGRQCRRDRVTGAELLTLLNEGERTQW